MNLKPHQTAILAAVGVGALSTLVPFVSQLFLPVVWLNTHIHELCHALVAWACGADVSSIHVYSNGSGVTDIAGGNILLEASAGYMGASTVGALMIFFSRSAKSARITLRVLAGALAFSMIMLVRGDAVGEVSGVGWILGLWAISYLDGVKLIFAAQLLGLMQCLNAVQSLYTLLKISAFTEGHSDAMILQQATGIPALGWATIWCVFSLFLMAFTLYRAWIKPPAPLRTGSFGAR
jgi:hypothetical protein